MSVEAKLRHLRTSPRKVRLVAGLVRGHSFKDAEEILRFTVKGPTKPVLKLIRSAAANAEHNFNIKKENLYIAEIRVDGGTILKRFMPRARGSVSPIHKKTSHVFVRMEEFGEKEGVERKGKKGKIKKIRQQEKPKEEVSKEPTHDTKVKEEAPKEPQRAKKQIFRRKSM